MGLECREVWATGQWSGGAQREWGAEKCRGRQPPKTREPWQGALVPTPKEHTPMGRARGQGINLSSASRATVGGGVEERVTSSNGMGSEKVPFSSTAASAARILEQTCLSSRLGTCAWKGRGRRRRRARATHGDTGRLGQVLRQAAAAPPTAPRRQTKRGAPRGQTEKGAPGATPATRRSPHDRGPPPAPPHPPPPPRWHFSSCSTLALCLESTPWRPWRRPWWPWRRPWRRP